MAKELPYFKFTVAEWLTGDIVYEPLNVQGLFINICAIYWQREGRLSIDDINKRFKNPNELAELSGRFFSVSDGFISVNFLDEQFQDRKQLSANNSKNGKKGGRPKAAPVLIEKPNANRTLSEPKANESNIEKRREEKNNIKENIKRKVDELLAETSWTEIATMQTKISLQAFPSEINRFVVDIAAKGELDKSLSELKRYFINWYKFNSGTAPEQKPKFHFI